jgi:hypothetical protein
MIRSQSSLMFRHRRTLPSYRLHMLPKNLDPDALRTIGIAALVVLVLVAFLVLRFVQKMVLRVVLLGVLAGLGVFVWWQRDNLHQCVPTCSCSVAGYTVQVPDCPTPTG